MDKRYQVFVSSTFQDLEEERQEVMHALLELDCIPAGMELFPAANEAQWDLIKKVIDDSDYYILIVAGRYGTISPSGISYTEMEYDYAIKTGKPIISFIHKNPGEIPSNKSEVSDEGRKNLERFKCVVQERLCKFWLTGQELGSVVSRSLVQLIRSQPAIGWVRADKMANDDATREILSLKKQIEKLNEHISEMKTSAPDGAEKLAQGDDQFEISFKVVSLDLNYERFISNFNTICSWNDIFSFVSPHLMGEATGEDIKNFLDSFIENYTQHLLSTQLPQHSIRGCKISSESYGQIIVQLRALGLIKKSEKARSVKDREVYWCLTDYGDEVMTKLLAIKKHDAFD